MPAPPQVQRFDIGLLSTAYFSVPPLQYSAFPKITASANTYMCGSRKAIAKISIRGADLHSFVCKRGNIMSLVRWEPFGSVETLFNRMMPSAFAACPRLALE